MNSSEIKAEIAKVEQELKTLVENANNKFNILSGMKNAYQKVLTSLETTAKTAEIKVETEVETAATEVESKA